MLYGHSFRKAYISIGVGAAVMVLGVVVFGADRGDVEHELVGLAGFVCALACMFWLYDREDRARERSAAGRGSERVE